MPGASGTKAPRREDVRMATAKRTTMNKLNRERDLKEKRALKQERKAQKKLAAAEAAAAGEVDPSTEPAEAPDTAPPA